MQKLFTKATFIVSCVGCLVSFGCASVPSTEIVFAGIKAKFPKDTKADSLDISVKRGADTLTFKATNWSTQNNPLVIGASTEMIRAHYAGTEGLVRTSIEASKQGATKAVVP